LLNNSWFGKTCHSFIPKGSYFLADAGYKLYSHIMTPYKIIPGSTTIFIVEPGSKWSKPLVYTKTDSISLKSLSL
jgi:hypothetical protein